MMKKGFYLSRLLYSILFMLILTYLYVKTPNGKIVLIPFLVCGTAVILKNIFLLKEKDNHIMIFNKIYVVGFMLFWFGFLIYFSYISIINKEYSLLLFSVPFWIVGIFILRKNLFNKFK